MFIDEKRSWIVRASYKHFAATRLVFPSDSFSKQGVNESCHEFSAS